MAFSGDPVARLDEVLKQGSDAVQYIPGISEAEKFFDAVGLGKGPFAPVGRAAISFAVVAGIQHLVKPGYAYDEQGNVRPWRYGPGQLSSLVDEETGEAMPSNATSFPWFFLPGIGAVVGGMIV